MSRRACIDLAQRYDLWARSGYRPIARNLTTLVDNVLGFMPGGSGFGDVPAPLAGIALADGDYEIRFEVQGYTWAGYRAVPVFRVSILGGLVVPIAPPVATPLTVSVRRGVARISWSWYPQIGGQEPDDFGIWIAAGTPVDTSGDPDCTVGADIPRMYRCSVAVPAGGGYAAVRSRAGACLGPVREIALGAASAPVVPPWQYASER